MIPYFKNVFIDGGHGDLGSDSSNKNCWFSKHADYPTFKYGREEHRNKGNINKTKASHGKPVNEKDLIESLQNILQISKQSSEICSVSL